MGEISGTKVVFGLTMAGTAVLAALTTLVAHLGVGAMVTVRVLQGFLEAPSYPILAAMIAKWSPKDEYSSFMALVNSHAWWYSGGRCDLPLVWNDPAILGLGGSLLCYSFRHRGMASPLDIPG